MPDEVIRKLDQLFQAVGELKAGQTEIRHEITEIRQAVGELKTGQTEIRHEMTQLRREANDNTMRVTAVLEAFSKNLQDARERVSSLEEARH